MPHVVLKNITEATFRANPNYKLVLFDRLSHSEQQLLQGLQLDPAFYGLLCPREATGLGVKSVCRDTALLFFTLQEPGSLPAYVRTIFGDECNQSIAELVLDQILEIEANGIFLSGSQAHPLILGENSSYNAKSTLAKRSAEALRYAQSLNIIDSQKLSIRLYLYGRQPLTPEWKYRLSTSNKIDEYLGINSTGTIKSILNQNWITGVSSQHNDIWLRWKSRNSQRVHQKSGPTYKLYISPTCEFIGEAFQTAVKVITTLRVPYFKVGGDVYGLLRPDKLVVYFWDFDELQEASDKLFHNLSGCPTHGVPFTAEIAGGGLLSWGIDPPLDHHLPEWQQQQSWRLWITNHLAANIIAAKAAPSDGIEPWQFAMDRLQLDGVDTQSWAPTQTIWMENSVEMG